MTRAGAWRSKVEPLLHTASEQAVDAGQVTSQTSSCIVKTLSGCWMSTVIQALLLSLASMYLEQSGCRGQAVKGPICSMDAADFLWSLGC